MKLIRYEYPSLETNFTDFDRWFDTMFRNFSRRGALDSPFGVAARQWTPAVDLFEDEQNVYARFELPGIKRDDIKVELENQVLSVEVDLKEEGQGEGEERRSQRTFSRSISVPDSVDPENVKAKHEDGVLTITMAKREARKPRAITVD